VDCMHSDRLQYEREDVLKTFKDGKLQILIGTDVIGRGLDIETVGHVINYDMPKDIDSYVHHVGRTGRAGNSGNSISYFTVSDCSLVKGLIKVLIEAKQVVPEWLGSLLSLPNGNRRAGRGGGKGGAMRNNRSFRSSPYSRK